MRILPETDLVCVPLLYQQDLVRYSPSKKVANLHSIVVCEIHKPAFAPQ